MKRSISFICLLTIIITTMFQFNLHAAELLATDKTDYTEGEDIYITAVGEGDDWVGVYEKDDTIGETVSIRWYYVAKEGNVSGTAKNIFDSEYINRESLAALPAGEYRIYLFDNGGYDVLSSADIIVRAKSGETPGQTDSEKTLKTDKTVYTEGEPIMTSATGDGLDWVGLYLRNDTPETDQSIRWYYVAKDGNVSGDEKNIRFAEGTNSSRAKYADVPAGDYTVYLFENDKYKVLAKIDITVNEDSNPAASPEAPSSVKYDRIANTPGFADGTLTITAGGGSTPDSYVAYWGDSKGALADYTAFAPIKYGGKTTKYDMVPNTLIPASADRIIVYAAKGSRVSEKAAEVMLPEGCNVYDFGTPLYEMQVLSDIHLNPSNAHIHNKHFAMALEEIKKISPASIGIFINGDIADHGEISEYKVFNKLIKDAGDGIPAVYCAIGNHDLASGPYEEKLKNFLEYTEPGTDTVYYDMWLNGAHFIFLGSEAPGLNADLSSKQLKWFKEKLAEDRDENRPTYVFLHQGLVDTVAGTFKYQKWHGINQSKKFAEILSEYPEVVLFSGHSHWEMDSLYSMKARDDKLPTIFNTAAGAYLWNDEAMSTNVGIEGSQGYFIYAYADKLLVLGRDFVNGQWISSAQFAVSYPGGASETADPDAETEDPGARNDDEQSSSGQGSKGGNAVAWAVGGSVGAVAAAGAAAAIVIAKKRKNKAAEE